MAVCLAVVALAAVAGVAIALTPEPVSSGALGPDWQCARIALAFTSCTRLVRPKTADAPQAGKGPSCLRPAAWRYAFGFRGLL
jgi:hypothetical protein